MPFLLSAIATFTLALGVVCAAWLTADVIRRPPAMSIMAVVWPVCSLFGGPLLVWFYRAYARAPRRGAAAPADDERSAPAGASSRVVAVAKGALHCGAGCTLGDLIAETLAFLLPAMLVAFGYPALFGEQMFAVWILDFIFAFALGIVFQYAAIAPMNNNGVWRNILAALKADTLSLLSWQIGMYGAMAIAMFAIYQPVLGQQPNAASPVFWMTMQVAMLVGFCTAFPMNSLLIRWGVKESM